MSVRIRRGLLLAVCPCVLTAALTAPSNAQVALPEVVVTAPSPIQRSRPSPATNTTEAPAPDLQGTLPIVTDQFATVTVVPNDDIRRSGASHARRPAVRQARHHRLELRARRLQPADHSRPRRQSRAHPGKRHRRQRRVRSGRGPFRAGRSAHHRPGRGDPRAGHLALRFAGDRRRGGDDQQPHPDHDPARASAPSSGRRDLGRQRPRRRGAARCRRRQFRRSCRRLRPQDARLPRAALSLSDRARSGGAPNATQPGAFNGRQPNSGARNDGQAVGGSYIFNEGFVGLAVTQNNALYHIPGIDGETTIPASTPSRPKC